MQNSNYEKNHFFIGNIFTDENQIRLLRNIQKKLKKKYGLKNYHWNNVSFSDMIYLGYFTTEVAQIYMEEIISHLLKAISERFSPLNCQYTGFKLDYDKSFYKISLKFVDTNNYLESIIIPYLHQNAILPVFPNRKAIKKPAIDLIYFKNSYVLSKKTDLKEMKDSIKIQFPTDTFKIDHISLIKGSTTRSRSGTPSTHNQMNLVEVSRYNFPLKNVNNSNIKENNNLMNSNGNTYTNRNNSRNSSSFMNSNQNTPTNRNNSRNSSSFMSSNENTSTNRNNRNNNSKKNNNFNIN
jgi:hypothetical protein